MRPLGASIAWRIVLAALATGVIAALVSAVISIVVINRIVDGQAANRLHARAAAIAELPSGRASTATRLVVARERYALVSPSGRVNGPASRFATPAIVLSLQNGRPVSLTADVPSGSVILEAVPRDDGGGVIGTRPVADVRASNQVFLQGVLLALAAGVVAALATGLLAGRRLGAPLGSLAGDARRLAQGERGLAITPQSVPEIDDIAGALRSLDTALSTSEARQREFLLSISHELRTPLTALRGYAEALADGVVPDDEVAEVGRTLVAESDRLGRFTTDLLELARLEADDFRIEYRPVPLDDVLTAAADAWRAAASRAGVGVQFCGAGASTVVRSDAQRLRQLVDGLLENAVRATPDGGSIRITGFAGSTWGVDVDDDGPGIDPEVIGSAFERGSLRDRYRGERPVGSGLGLSIARRLVARLGGTITVDRGPRGGALFRVEFPGGLPDPDTPSTDG